MKVYVVEVRNFKILRNVDDYDTGIGGTVGVFNSKKKAIEYILKLYNTECLVLQYLSNRGGQYVFDDDNLRVTATIREWEVNKGEMDEMEALL